MTYWKKNPPVNISLAALLAGFSGESTTAAPTKAHIPTEQELRAIAEDLHR